MNELVDKINTAYDRHGRRGGRTAFIWEQHLFPQASFQLELDFFWFWRLLLFEADFGSEIRCLGFRKAGTKIRFLEDTLIMHLWSLGPHFSIMVSGVHCVWFWFTVEASHRISCEYYHAKYAKEKKKSQWVILGSVMLLWHFMISIFFWFIPI